MAVTGTFTATGQSPTFRTLVSNFDAFVHAASWTGNSVQLERTFDLTGATGWQIVSEDASGTTAVYTQDFNGVIFDPNPSVLYRWNCTLWASTISYRIG